ncbi:unnamed protein product [Pelagomonas calceolata]|uniref:Uncharacterized protein n=1 Tax=Pelagomonas calceolata TaxID=35677 RepID=A0A8J2SP10_9STRA|nr:unnamed protein product [Pelagomonas calceolata]
MSIEWINDDDGALGLTKLFREAKKRGATSTDGDSDDAGAFTEASLPDGMTPLLKQALLPPLRKKKKARRALWSPRLGKSYHESWAFHDRLRATLAILLQRAKHKGEPHVVATQALFDRLEALNGAMADYTEATSPEVNAIVQAGKEVCLAAKACADGTSTKGQFRRLIATMVMSSSRGVEPKDVLKEVVHHVGRLVEYHGNHNGWEEQILIDGALYRTPQGGFEHRTPPKILKRREDDKKRRKDTREGKRKPKNANHTTAGHEIAFKAESKKAAARREKTTRAKRGVKIPTPQYCMKVARVNEGVTVVKFIVNPDHVPDGFDNKPTSPEQAYKNALECLRRTGKKTVEERAAEKELPEKVRRSRAKSRRGKYIVQMNADKAHHSGKIRKKFKCFCVVKPGTDGYYSESGAVEVRDDFIKAKCPFDWCSKPLK